MEIVKKTRLFIGFASIIMLLFFGCSDDNIVKLDPVITWEKPSDIKFGNPLSADQLNASADVLGSFEYTPGTGVVLDEGDSQLLTVEFSPVENDNYNNVNKSVQINVLPSGTSSAMFNPNLNYGTMSDVDGNNYKTIVIGSQTWMAENLRTTKYRNGDDIPNVTGNSEWINLNSGAFCTYDNDSDLDALATFGRLYNWFSVSDSRNIAPEGWHVATETEWAELATYLEGLTIAGGKLKESGNTHWNAPNTGASNSSGFTALPAGRREYVDGSFINIGYNSFWWTSSAYNPDYSWYFQLSYDFANVVPANFHKQYGFSVRCIKDN